MIRFFKLLLKFSGFGFLASISLLVNRPQGSSPRKK